ncbi:ABC transporter permease [Paralimibaculum aggregatum]|uniref:ABC transporter permease n=1 Tax=Paralimibaculum aggregatum TaxID=3036245 RepID=A0ABQ6LQX7_9RHOB|nr:ABC transporter permease [Limibaculum sp. NKW23]GMG83316.1 ABC transporter permease [Limibaculum sp. NKW23]
MDLSLPLKHWDMFAAGVWMTLQLTFLALVVGFCIALPSALALCRGSRWSPLIRSYVYVFRGTPLIVQTYLIYYGLGQFEWVRESVLWPLLREAWWCALIAFSLNSGAYATEILRGAIATTPKGELEGGRALGLSEPQITRLVLLPSALRRALPQYGNEIVFMLHGSVVASVITIQDILGAGRTLNGRYYVAYEGFVTAALLYMAITFAIVFVFRQIERHYLRHLNIQPATRKGIGPTGVGALDPAAAR